MDDSTGSQTALEIIARFRLIFLAASLTLITGTVFYHIVEKWTWLDSVYFSVVSLTTVGYGDLTPTTSLGKLFTIFYLIIGISIIAALINNLLKHAVAKHDLRKERETKK